MRLSYLNAVESELLSTLSDAGVAFAVVGGHAVLCYSPPERDDGSIRTLGDLDVLVSADMANLPKISRALSGLSLRIDLSADELRTAFATGKLPNLNMYRAQLFPEILGISTPDVLEHALLVPSSVGPLPVISLPDLVAAKRAAGRPKDLEDLAALERTNPGASAA